ncbi:hypothetical protein FISHEDRAFT_78317 [Fistulina hepatica ATCC 64428]|nr:hypothetical protein FISHEDRAFT_78317 [Fistulina hepatica ATCC 64428]
MSPRRSLTLGASISRRVTIDSENRALNREPSLGGRSHTLERRVLTEIDWWRVTEGQYPTFAARNQVAEDNENAPAVPLVAPVPQMHRTALWTDSDVVHGRQAVSSFALDFDAYMNTTTVELAALTLSDPHSPLRSYLHMRSLSTSPVDSIAQDSCYNSPAPSPSPVSFLPEHLGVAFGRHADYNMSPYSASSPVFFD